MAKKPSHSNGTNLTTQETILGWLYLPIYLIALNVGINYLNRKLSLGLGNLGVNIVYFSVNLLFVCVAFRRFLRQHFFGHGFWEFVQAVILGFVLYYAATYALRFVLSKLAGDYTIYNDELVDNLVQQNRYVMMVITIVAAPIVEETLIRGVVFGSLHATSRVLAYIMSCLIFILMHNWQYFGTYPVWSVVFSCLAYVPASFSLAWTYEKSDTIWASITMHALMNAAAFGLQPMNF